MLLNIPNHGAKHPYIEKFESLKARIKRKKMEPLLVFIDRINIWKRPLYQKLFAYSVKFQSTFPLNSSNKYKKF